jgi:hypothetical protein
MKIMEKRFKSLLGDMIHYDCIFSSIEEVGVYDTNVYYANIYGELIRIENGYFSEGEYRLVGFKLGYESNQIYLLETGKEETVDNISVLPLENLEYCDTWSDGVLDDKDIQELRCMIHKKLIGMLKEL